MPEEILSKWRPGPASEVVACFSKTCFPVSPACNSHLQSGYISPQFLWDHQCLKVILHFLTHQEEHRVAAHVTAVAIARQSWDTSSTTLPVLSTICYKASKWTSYAKSMYSLVFLQILETFFLGWLFFIILFGHDPVSTQTGHKMRELSSLTQEHIKSDPDCAKRQTFYPVILRHAKYFLSNWTALITHCSHKFSYVATAVICSHNLFPIFLLPDSHKKNLEHFVRYLL